ncbi:laminin subunit alpha-3-like isoform X2 [Xenia sp. Carnegie-2017]|uniref:laminin subunit alpha-3-like isoform X2 n=1 Tax=Xenia sp. Carnegie-2017 TaxID=2897299 RepID=UPI001F0362B7|nr:laminin subunit alpha-3-like isoform X2 [Xenia sp. Carnegie-2017]
MFALWVLRSLVAIYSIEALASITCAESHLKSGKNAFLTPLISKLTCETFHASCKLNNGTQHDCGVCANDSSRPSWKSLVYPKGSAEQHVDIVINLEQATYLNKITLNTAFTPLPSFWAIEKYSSDETRYRTLAVFVSDVFESVCDEGFNETSEYQCIVQQPIKTGSSHKVVVPFLSGRVNIKKLRLRFFRLPKSNTPHEFERFYSIKEITIEGFQVHGDHKISLRSKRQACICSRYGTSGFVCNPLNGNCPCKRGYSSKRCTKCSKGYYNYPRCTRCECSTLGAISPTSCRRRGGQCRCRPLITGRKCDKCQKGYYGFPKCKWCNCHVRHTTSEGCDSTGKCLCKENYDGVGCGECKLGYVNYPTCTKLTCTCPLAGSTKIACNAAGRCDCKEGYIGWKCDRCKSGFYGYPNCKACECHNKGSSSSSRCNYITGQCSCVQNVGGRKCDRCVSGYFGFPRCRPCVCNPIGTLTNITRNVCASGNDEFQCVCKKNVGGETCNRCKDLYYDFSPRNRLGCRSCGCFKSATIGGLESCDDRLGKCSCKPFMQGTKCYECKRGYHSFQSLNIFGCQACQCNPGGSLYGNCDKRNGKCRCRQHITGEQCDRLESRTVYFPSLHHIKFEVENGIASNGKPVKYEFDSNIFPSYSWKGYVKFSPEQSGVVLTVQIPRRSLYRILFRCIFEPVGYPWTTDVRFTVSPTEGVAGFARSFSMTMSSTRNENRERSALLSVSKSNVPYEVLMFKGAWKLTIFCESKYFYMDSVVFLPEEYYTGRILKTERFEPCAVNSSRDRICDMYSYPEVSDKNAVKHEAENGYFAKEAWGQTDKLGLKYYSSTKVLNEVRGNRLVLMNHEQHRFSIDITIPSSGFYAFIIHYISNGNSHHKIDIYIHRDFGAIYIVPCKYRFGCRQVAMKADAKVVKFFDLDKGRTPVKLFTSREAHVAVDYVSAIPRSSWHPGYIKPAFLCRSLQHQCTQSTYERPTTFEQHRTMSKSVVQRVGSVSGSREKDALVQFREFFNRKLDNFVIIIQYQQTKNIAVIGRISITTFSTELRGVAEFKYCPNTEFCRIEVKSSDGRGYFRIRQGTTRIQVRYPLASQVKLSWVYRIPLASYSNRVLSFTPADGSNTWVERCSRNNYLIDPSEANYCRNTSFALVTSFNNGAFRCRCSFFGASSPYCNKIHGQCTCRRPNIIGRQCTECRSGYYGFPYCRACTCDPRGVERVNCDRRGRCKCKPNFSGRSCNRCKSGYFMFPTCKPCNCDIQGSLSMFCGSTSGQCQCRRAYGGKKCDRCRVGFFGFPECKECNCDVSGIKPVEGSVSGCNSTQAIVCKCKENVRGEYCDTCKDFYYNLRFSNPKGCQKCSCSDLGTNSKLKNCDKVSGQCSCKPRVARLSCSVCKDGSTSLRDYSVFGCKGCGCNYGGSLDNICDKNTGNCSCKSNVGGKKCDQLKSSRYYERDLHHIRAEFEDGITDSSRPLRFRYNQSEFPDFFGRGYVPTLNNQNSFDIIVAIPRPTKYRLLIRYSLDSYWSTRGQVTISPTRNVDALPQGYKSVVVVSLQFKPTSTRRKVYAEFLTVKEGARETEFFLSRGKWRISLFVAPSKLLLDYLVMLPEDYYKATHVRRRVEEPCVVNTQTEFCVDYKYLSVVRADAVTVRAKMGVLSGAPSILPYTPFTSYHVLNNRNQLYLPLPTTKYGSYVLMVTYYQETKAVSSLFIDVRAGFGHQVGQIRTFYCKYTFGCRQVATDYQNKVKAFGLLSNSKNHLTISANTVVSLESVIIIPIKKWSMEYIQPGEYCVKSNGTCLLTTYPIPSRAIKVEAETSGGGMRPSLALDSSVRAAYLAGDGVSLRIRSTIAPGRYIVIVHYYQPSYGDYKGKIILESGRVTALYLKFQHCPNVGGCRALARDKTTDMPRSLYISANLDITILNKDAPDREVWIDYVLFVPNRHFTNDMEKQLPVNLATRFIKQCGRNHLVINSSDEFCKQSVFKMTTMFNGDLAACDCNGRGSMSSSCEQFGGQCTCKANIVGRKCDKCRGGYTGFPNCRRR